MGSTAERAKIGASMNRRQIIQALAAASLASPSWAQDAPLAYPFTLGVASGDPGPDGFAIWTRLAPQALAPHGGMPMRRLPVRWEIATDEKFGAIVQTGEEIARPEFAHAIHAEATGLSPLRPYWYRFICYGQASPVGRAFTTPAADADVRQLRIAAAGCQHYEQGLYTAFRHLAAEDVAFVFHYGDYIYENSMSPAAPGAQQAPRTHLGGECFTLDEYRLRYAQYKSDPDLQAAHAVAPWFVVFDDHEVNNNWVGEIDQNGSPPAAFALRRAMAWQAWAEHMPIRKAQLATLTGVQLYRSASYGKLLQAYFLDTRQFRSDQPCDDGFKPRCAGVDARDARVIGPEEERWLYAGLARAKPSWNLIGQQTMLLDLDRRGASTTPLYNMDSWAGYQTPRHRLLNKLRAMKLNNVVVLTGDEHQNFANEIRLQTNDAKSPIVAHEFVATSISSGGDGPGERADHATILSHNPDCRLINDKRGYAICDVTPEAWTTTFKVVDKVSAPGGALSTLAAFAIERGKSGMQKR